MTRESATTYHPEATRRALLEAAFEEIWRCGFRAASLDQILTQTGVTKGALYHHFQSKLELGYAVVDEVLRTHVRERWIQPLDEADDPIDALQHLRDGSDPARREKELRQGCPLNNLAQEMSGVDDEFRRRVHGVLMEWRDAIAAALRRGQEQGQVRDNIRPDDAATFILAVLEGTAGLSKSAQDPSVCDPCFDGLHHYLEALRPRREFRR